MSSKIYLAGYRIMVVRACLGSLTDNVYANLIGFSSTELDLRGHNH